MLLLVLLPPCQALAETRKWQAVLLLYLGVKHGHFLSSFLSLSHRRALDNNRSPPFLCVTTGLLMQGCLKGQLKQEQGQGPSGGN